MRKKERKNKMANIDKLWEKYSRVYCTDSRCRLHRSISKEDLTKAVAEVISIPVEAEVDVKAVEKWISSKDAMPKKYEPVLVYDQSEIEERDKYFIDYIFIDNNGDKRWDWVGDKQVYWQHISRFSD